MTDRRDLLKESLAAIERLQARLDASDRARHEPIAIVGAGCRYPGGIESPEDLWRLVRDGVDAVAEVPADRWDAAAFYDADPAAPGKMVTKRGGFLSQVDRFDPQFFGISPREAATMDPQQRLLLETAVEALESAGIATDRLAGSATGVFVGITTSDYGQMMRLGGPENSDVYSATGTALNAAAGRIAFTFGLQGPCVAVDTACSSSLVATHLACQSLRARESNLALAGGVNVVLSPDAMVLFSKWGMMAPDGACKTFDAAADGFVRAEGCAVIALKRLSDALAAGDPILALIRGSAVNSDGRSSGLTVPNGPAQQAVIRQALANARLSAGDIDYVEAHGTGTPLGDPIEVEALGEVMREGRPRQRPLLIGSIKTNIGHSEAASGLAGLLKVVASLRHEAIPPHLHFSQPNPGIPWADLPIAVPTALTPWPRGARPRLAGVSAFGFSGTNAHIVLEEAPLVPAASPVATPTPVLVPLSARDDVALRALALRHANFLTGNVEVSLPGFAATAATGRAHLSRRLALLAESVAGLEQDLRLFASGQTPPLATEGAARPGDRPKVAFLFTGQGAQYAGMGRGLYDTEPVFRATLDRAATILAPHLGQPLLEVLFPADPAATRLGETAFTQPTLFAFEYALAELWASWGITPAVVAGHSVGEYVAACVAGVFSFEEGLALIAERGRMMQALPAGGGMAAVFASEAQVARRISAFGDRLTIAAVNGPEETVISGDTAAITEVLAGCETEGIQSRTLEVSHAFHSPLLDPMLDALEHRASAVTHAVPRIPLVSNLTGAVFPAGGRPDARYWRRHAREPVRFAECIDALRAAGVTALIEVGPHPTLLALAARALPEASWIALASLRRGRDDRREILSALGALYVRGAAVRWESLSTNGSVGRMSLPTYPFQRERYWVEPAPHAPRDTRLPEHSHGRERPDLSGGHRGGLDEWYYDVRWERQQLAGPRARGADAGVWLVFADQGGVGEAMAACRRAAGERTVIITPGDRWSLDGDRATIRPNEPGDYLRLFDAVGRPTAAVHLWTLNASARAEPTADALATGPESLLHLLQGLVRSASTLRPRLWIVTADSQAVIEDDRCDSPLGALMWGLGGTLSAEHAELWGGLADLSSGLDPDVASLQLIREVEMGTAEDKVAFRQGERYVSRLARRQHSGSARRKFVPRADGTYLITGGLGGIGLSMARWLVELGARNLLLVGRTPLPPRASWADLEPGGSDARRARAVAALESLGARVESAAMDVSSRESMEELLDARGRRGEPPVRGVIHAAGTLRFEALATQDMAALRAGLAAKVHGAWRLHELFGNESLDCFVLCSSSSALFRSPLLGGYAAGNAFLDALAHHRHAQGLAALSVNWGTWGEVGMAVEAGHSATGAMLAGMGTIPTERGLAALQELLEAGAAQVAVMPVDWAELARAYPGFAADPFLAEVIGAVRQEAHRADEGDSTLAALRAASGSEAAGLTRDYLRCECARVLGMRTTALDPDVPLSSLGFDSLMAVQLKNRIQTDLNVVVPMIEFLQGRSVDQLTPLVVNAGKMTPESSEADVSDRSGSWDEGSL